MRHDVEERRLRFVRSAILGSPRTPTEKGTAYFEVSIVDLRGDARFGFAGLRYDPSTGLGDDDRHAWTLRAEAAAYGAGDVLRFAADLESGAVAFSEGEALVWSIIATDDENVRAGAFPLIAAGDGTALSYRVAPPFAHAPPDGEFWARPASKRDLLLTTVR